jgi:hypothetical protein
LITNLCGYICAMRTIRHYENLHIPLWLLKDTCWMLQWRYLGITMIVPTLAVAIYLTYKSCRDKNAEWLINLAITFWICANSYWMCCEFFKREDIKNFAGIPFVLGMISVAIFYLLPRFKKSN